MRRHTFRVTSLVLTSFVLSAGTAQAVVRLQVQQVGSNVVITGSGSANTLGLTPQAPNLDLTNVLTDNQIFAGPDAFGNGSGAGGDGSVWSSITGPTAFGNDPAVSALPSSGSGDLFGIIADFVTPSPQLILPLSYTSGSPLNGTTTFLNQTLTSLGLTPGSSFTWSWGSGGTADSLVLEVQGGPSAASVPAPLPMLGAALALGQSRRLRRRTKALAS